MDDLFRFTIIRPPKSADGITIKLEATDSRLQATLWGASTPAAKRDAARSYRDAAGAVFTTIEAIPVQSELAALAEAFAAISGGDERAAVGEAITDVLGTRPPSELFADVLRLRDTFLSFLLAPDPKGPSLSALARDLRTLDVVWAYWNQLPVLSLPGAVQQTMNAPILLPPSALSPQAGRPWPVGFADLLVVKQHILRYEGGEVARIENILHGETRKHGRKHTISSERERTVELERTTEETEERTVSERSKLSAEVERALKEQWNVKAGVELGYGKEPAFFIRANAGFTYDRISEESSKYATEVAKEVTTKAASKVSERVREVERRRLVETLEDLEEQGFSNENGANVSGVYQFVDKVYRCRVYSYGKRWLLDFMVPEPAAYLLSARTELARAQNRGPQPPPLLTHNGKAVDDATDPGQPLVPTASLEAADMRDPADPTRFIPNPFYYAQLVARYGVAGVEPPPAPTLQVSKSFGLKSDLVLGESIAIPDGYFATRVAALGMWHGSADSHVAVYVADLALTFRKDPADGERHGGPFYQELSTVPSTDDTLATVTSALPVAILGVDATSISFNLVVTCELRPHTLQVWRHQTYERILSRYEQLRKDYEDQQIAQGLLQRNDRKLGRSPEQNRVTERLEIKKAAIAVLEGQVPAGYDLVAEPSTSVPPPAGNDALPAPDVAVPGFEEALARVRFLEQAFEWENLSYALYPYFWGRSSGWRESLARLEDDAMFESFLRAGAARVVLAIRPGFAEDVFYYLATGLAWSGTDVPVIGDPRYVPIVEELRQQAGAIEAEPYGDDWELRLATDLVKLRPDDELPEWEETTTTTAAEPRTWIWAEKKRP